jgi:AcrR family transcriptional regulator
MPFTKRQTDILDTVMRIIQVEGPDAVTVHAIASALSLTDPAIYRHFKSKDDIFFTLFTMIEELERSIAAGYEVHSDRGIDALESAIFGWARLNSEKPYLSYVNMNFAAIFKKYPELFKKLFALRIEDQSHALAAIDKAVSQGDIRGDIDRKNVGRIIFGGYLSLFTTWANTNFTFSIEEAIEQFWPDIKRILSPPAGGKR